MLMDPAVTRMGAFSPSLRGLCNKPLDIPNDGKNNLGPSAS